MKRKKGSARSFISTQLSIIVIVVAGISAYMAYQSVKQNKNIAKFQTFLTLRSEFKEIMKTLPPDYREEGVRYLIGSQDWISISNYWSHAFNEWTITTQFGKGELQELWDKYYKDAICEALQKDAIRSVFYDLRDSAFNSEMEKKFALEVEKVYKEKSKHPLTPN